MPEPLSEDLRRLLNDLPPGRLVGPRRDSDPMVWRSDGPIMDAADWWKRLSTRRYEIGLYPILLEYPDDSRGEDRPETVAARAWYAEVRAVPPAGGVAGP